MAVSRLLRRVGAQTEDKGALASLLSCFRVGALRSRFSDLVRIFRPPFVEFARAILVLLFLFFLSFFLFLSRPRVRAREGYRIASVDFQEAAIT